MNIKTVFNSENYDGDNEFFMEDDLAELISEHIPKGRGTTVGYAAIAERSSRYGSIGGGGDVGYTKTSQADLARAIMGLSPNSDFITVNSCDDVLQANYHDHDGTHHITLKRITASKEEAFNNKLQNGTHDEIIKYLEAQPSIKFKKNAFV